VADWEAMDGRAVAQELVGMFGAGLARIVELVGPETGRALAADAQVAALMSLCGVHPDAPAVRVERALREAGIEVTGVEPAGELVRVHVVRDDGSARAFAEAAAPDAEIEIVAQTSFVPLGKLVRHERCDVCGQRIEAQHEHVLAGAELRCACAGCALGAASRVPRTFERLAIDARAWLAKLGAPVNLAAVVVRDGSRASLIFPNAAGRIESDIDAAKLDGLVLAPEVEALLLVADRGAWRCGIDVIHELGAELRASRGDTAVIAKVLDARGAA
jgi:hypothetical protein